MDQNVRGAIPPPLNGATTGASLEGVSGGSVVLFTFHVVTIGLHKIILGPQDLVALFRTLRDKREHLNKFFFLIVTD